MSEADSRLARFYDLPIEVAVELDRRQMKVREVLTLQIGSVIKMNRSAGENMTLMFHGRPAGYGEIVVIEDTMGIRVTDLFRELG